MRVYIVLLLWSMFVCFIFLSQVFPCWYIFLRTDMMMRWFFFVHTHCWLVHQIKFIHTLYASFTSHTYSITSIQKHTHTHTQQRLNTSKYDEKKNKNKPNLCYFFLFNVSFCLHFSPNFFSICSTIILIIHVPISIYSYISIDIDPYRSSAVVRFHSCRSYRSFTCHQYGSVTYTTTLPICLMMNHKETKFFPVDFDLILCQI